MQDIRNSRFVQNLKRQAEENPIVVIGVSAAFITAVSKLLDSNTKRSYAKANAQEIERRKYKTYNNHR